MGPNDADGIANSVDPDQTVPRESGSALFVQAYALTCAPSEDSDQPGHPSILFRDFAVRMKKAWS